MALQDLLKRRHAAKGFDGKPITAEQLKLLKEAIRLSPSSFNSQPWKVKIVSDAATKQMLSPLSWNQPQITTCSHLFIFCTSKDVPKRFDELYSLMEKSGVPAKSVDGFKEMTKGSLERQTPEQQVIWMQRQVYLPLMSLMLAATELGLDSCPMEGFDADGYAKALNITDAVPTVLCPVGHAEASMHGKVRFLDKDVFF